jgi:hypothetical protein
MNRGCRARRDGDCWSKVGRTPQGPPLSLKVEQKVHGLLALDDPLLDAPVLLDPVEAAAELVELPPDEGMYRWRPMRSRSFSPMLLAAASWATVRPLAWDIAHKLSPGWTTYTLDVTKPAAPAAISNPRLSTTAVKRK